MHVVAPLLLWVVQLDHVGVGIAQIAGPVATNHAASDPPRTQVHPVSRSFVSGDTSVGTHQGQCQNTCVCLLNQFVLNH